MDYWRGKIAVVTGASAGIGAKITLTLAREGIHVIGLARRPERVEQLASKDSSISGHITAFKCDVADPESIKTAFDWIKESFGRVDILVNNAGIYRIGNILVDYDNVKDHVDVVNTNFIGLVACSKEAFKLMKGTGDLGYIINISSHAAYRSSTGGLADNINVYSGSKFAVRAVTDVMRHELIGLRNNKIRISSISPGWVKSEIAHASKAPNPDHFFEDKPHLETEEIAEIVLFYLTRKPHIHIKDIIIQSVGEA